MNTSSAKFPSLKERAFDAFFKDVMSRSSPEFALEDVAFKIFFKDVCCKATPSTVEFVRDCFNKISWELGAKGDKYRDQCICKLSNRYGLRHRGKNLRDEKDDESEELPDPIVVLDCLLFDGRDYFDPGGFEIPLLTLESFSQLLSVFSHRCPGVDRLDLTFLPITTKKWTTSAAQCDASFSKLYELSLRFENEHYNGPGWEHAKSLVFSIIGKVCPMLSELYVSGFVMRKMDMLRLILVEDLADIVFRQDSSDDDDIDWSQDSLLPGLRVPSEFLNPLCFTLKLCELGKEPVINDSVKAFVLRHLRNFMPECFHPEPCEVPRFIKLGYQAEKLLETQRLDFGEACRAAAQRIGLNANHLVAPHNCHRDDFLFFDILECIPLDHADTLRGIGSLIPHLKIARFSADSGCVDELESILNGWPKVKCITISNDNFNYKCLQPITNVFGSSLVYLYLDECRDPIDLARLASCTVLHFLVIHNCTVVCEGEDPLSRWTPQTFLPSLDSLEIVSCCLGVWAPLLETKSMKYLCTDCCHIGTHAYNPRLEWSQVPQMWPNLEGLSLKQCTGLTMMELSSFIPQWKNLESIGVPKSIYTEDPPLTAKIIEKFVNRSKYRDFYISDDERYGIKRDVVQLCPYQERQD